MTNSGGDGGGGGSNPGGVPTSRVLPDCFAEPPTILHSGYRVFPVGQAAGAWCYQPSSSAKVANELDLYLRRPPAPA
jgi:hypothetical protein